MIIGSTRIPTDKTAIDNLLNHLIADEYVADSFDEEDGTTEVKKQTVAILDRFGNRIDDDLDTFKAFADEILKIAQLHGDTYAIRHVWINSKEEMGRFDHDDVIKAFEKEFNINPDSHAKFRVVHTKELTGGGYDMHEHLVYSERGYINDFKKGLSKTGKPTKAKNNSVIDDKERKIRQEKVARMTEVRYGQEITLGRHNRRVLEMIYEDMMHAKKYGNHENHAVYYELKSLYERLLDKFKEKLMKKAETPEEAQLVNYSFAQAKRLPPSEALKNVFVVLGLPKAKYTQKHYQIARRNGLGVEFKEAVARAVELWNDYDYSVKFEDYLKDEGFTIDWGDAYAFWLSDYHASMTEGVEPPERPKGIVYNIFYSFQDEDYNHHTLDIGSALNLFGARKEAFEKRLDYVPEPVLTPEEQIVKNMDDVQLAAMAMEDNPYDVHISTIPERKERNPNNPRRKQKPKKGADLKQD
jgi:hypothetical protein